MSEREILRGLICACAQTLASATRSGNCSAQDVREIATTALKRVQRVADEAEWRSAGPMEFRSAVHSAFQIISRRYENKSASPGLATGFTRLDELTSGFMSGDLIVLASEPCAGKSSLAAQITAHHALQEKQPVCVFSMKRSATEYALRMVAAVGSVDRQHLCDGGILEEEWPGITDAVTRLADAKIVIDATPTQTTESLRARMRATQRWLDSQPKLAVIDSLEQMDKPDLAADMRSIAREFEAAVLVLAQTRGAVNAHTRLRDAALEDHADVILLLDRDQTNNGESARLVVARNRNGRRGEVKLRYFPKFARFEEAPNNER
ncbi:MAG: AAA family ATPase [Proteobacteria bacterium]|nr:AAA family ATPase [Pseudomonadota bacterium]